MSETKPPPPRDKFLDLFRYCHRFAPVQSLKLKLDSATQPTYTVYSISNVLNETPIQIVNVLLIINVSVVIVISFLWIAWETVRGRMGQSQNGNDAITEICWEGPCSGNTESNTDDNTPKNQIETTSCEPRCALQVRLCFCSCLVLALHVQMCWSM